MAQRHDYWTHGVATILEDPDSAIVHVHRGDLGTVVEQEANTGAWFHLPIPTPTILDDSTVSFLFFALAARVNENAKMDRIDVRRGQDLIYSQDVSFTNTFINQAFDNPDVSTSIGASSGAGITLCVHVSFLSGTPRGRVEFYGAGAAFA